VFIAAVVFSVGVALLRGGRPHRLAAFPLRHLWLIFAAFSIQLAVHLPVVTKQDFAQSAAPYLYPVAYYLLLLCFALNRHAPGVLWLAAGTASNLAVILANGGKMPVDGEALIAMGCRPFYEAFAAGRSLTHTLIGTDTKLTWLADVFVGSPPFPKPTVFSVGDVLLAVGVFVLVQKTMVTPGRVRAGEPLGQTARE
jgi:hypothetical protein